MLHKIYEFLDQHFSELFAGFLSCISYNVTSSYQLSNGFVSRHYTQLESEAIHVAFSLFALVFGYFLMAFLKHTFNNFNFVSFGISQWSKDPPKWLTDLSDAVVSLFGLLAVLSVSIPSAWLDPEVKNFLGATCTFLAGVLVIYKRFSGNKKQNG